MNPFKSLHDYEEYIYTLRERFPKLSGSTLVIIAQGHRTSILEGSLSFSKGYQLTMREYLAFENDCVEITHYGYTLWHNGQKISWYDSQPHPNDLYLSSTHPHHKHVLPDIKHNRIPAPQPHSCSKHAL